MRSMSSEALLEQAQEARKFAYAPYSKFTVGAAVDVGDGKVVTGCNVENASYGLSICAERVALCNAVAQGYTRVYAIAVAGPESGATVPCGGCRQFMAEFDPNLPVSYTAPGRPVHTSLGELLPHSFGPSNLK